MQISRVLGRGWRSIRGPLPSRFTDRAQNILQLILGTLVRLGLALAVQPVWMDAPVVAAEELGQRETLHQQPMYLVLCPRLNTTDPVVLGKGDDQCETGVLNGRPKVLPC